MMEEIDRFQVPAVRAEMQPLQDPMAASISDRDCDTREGETVGMNYKPSPLQVKLEKQRELARKGSLKNGNMGSPVNQQPKKNNVMARTRNAVARPKKKRYHAVLLFAEASPGLIHERSQFRNQRTVMWPEEDNKKGYGNQGSMRGIHMPAKKEKIKRPFRCFMDCHSRWWSKFVF